MLHEAILKAHADALLRPSHPGETHFSRKSDALLTQVRRISNPG